MNIANAAKFCPGCGYPAALMSLGKVLDKMNLSTRAVLGLDIGCNLLAWNYLPINTFQTHHGRVTSTLVGFKKARPDSICIGVAGDGGAYAIGLQNLIHAAKRDEPLAIIVLNNTVYGMTGGQTAPTTLTGQKTDTHPEGSEELPLLGPELLKCVIKEGSFLARTAVNEPAQMAEYLEKAVVTQQSGHFSLVEVLSYCPTSWKTKGIETNDYLNDKLKPIFKLGVIS